VASRTEGDPGGWSAGRVIRTILATQILLAAVLVAGDLGGVLPRFDPRAPALDAPVAPGDQTRRYRLPRDPGTQPIPARGDLPKRLTIFPEAGGTAAMRGTIAPGDAPRIVEALSRDPPAAVTLNSPGGSVSDALAIGRAIRDAGIATSIDEGAVCLSACPYLLAAGVERTVADGALVGVHQHFFGQSTVLPAFLAVEDVQRGQGEVMEYLDDMGVDPMVMRQALATPPDEIYLLVTEELIRYRLVIAAEDAAED
jgi:hypothetical protein